MKKVLIVADIPTHLPNAGNRNCILQNVILLKECGFEVYFLLLQKEKLSEADMRDTLSFWGNKMFIYKQNFIQTLLQRLVHKFCNISNTNIPFLDLYCPWGASKRVRYFLNKYDIYTVIVNYIWLSKLLPQSKEYNTCIYTHDVFSNRNNDGKSVWFSFSPNTESKAIKRATHILAIQDRENIFYSFLSPGKDVRTIYMPFNFYETRFVENRNILFLSGNNEHNQIAIRTFVKNVLPILHSNIVDLKLIIGGGICASLNDLKDNVGVELVGYVDDPKDFYSRGNIVINPVFSGTGLKVKTFEAISYGRTVLVHPHSTLGIFEPDSAPLTVCETAADYLSVILTTTRVDCERNSQNCYRYIKRLNNYIKKTYQEIL